jgi:hypothetical protein
LLAEIVDGDENIDIRRHDGLEVIERGDSTSNRIGADDAVGHHPVDDLERALHALHDALCPVR